jgi:hypothetical protein
LDSLLTYYGYPDVVAVRYHGEDPWAYDPFYLANPVESAERYGYYSISGIPANFLDGKPAVASCFIELVRDAIEESREISAPLEVVASDSLTGDSCFVSVTVIGVDDPGPDSLTLRAAVVEDNIYYEAPNSQTIFNYVFRRFIPDHSGTRFAIAQDETADFYLAFELDPSWNPSYISTTVLVQNDSTREVHQTASSKARPPGWARFTAPERGRVKMPGQQVVYPGEVVNLGAQTDTFDIDLSGQLPADWSASYEVVGGTLVAGGVALERDSTCSINLRINCGYDPGTGEVRLEIRSRNDTSFVRGLDYFAISGVCGLLVDDDGGLDREDYFESALDSVGVVWGRWERRFAEPQVSDLNKAEFVIWFTGEYFPTLEAHDQDLLSSYLDGGGNLFITGQDIGYALNFVNSGEYTPDTEIFYETYFGAEWIMPNASLFDLAGKPGDPISDGIALTIEGGDGAGNQDYPDVIDAIAPASVILDYTGDPLKHGGVRFEFGSSKVVYLSFGFEAISTAEDRELLLSRIVDWFGKTAGIEEPPVAAALSVYPNPAATYLAIDLGGMREGKSLEIYDVRGRVVFSQVPDRKQAVVWDLRDRSGKTVAPGVYFVSVGTDAGPVRRKVVLAR